MRYSFAQTTPPALRNIPVPVGFSALARRVVTVALAVSLTVLLTVLLAVLITVLPTGIVSTSFAEELFKTSLGEVQITLRRTTPGPLLFTVKAPHVERFSVLEVRTPNRIVLDLFGARGAGQHRYELPSTAGPLKTMRVGEHKEKLRVVLDVNGESTPQQRSVREGDEFILTIGGDDESVQGPPPPPKSPERAKGSEETNSLTLPSPTPVPREDAAAASLTPSPIPDVASTPTNSPTPTLTAPDPTPPLTPRSVTTASEEPLDSTSQLLYGVQFDFEAGASASSGGKSEKLPLIRLKLTQRPQFRISRKDDRTFRLKISGAHLHASATGLPQFPPAEFSGFTFVQATNNGEDVEVIVGVERKFKVVAAPFDKEILLRTSGGDRIETDPKPEGITR